MEYAAPDADLGEMLVAGEIDALIAADVPKAVLNGRPEVGRLYNIKAMIPWLSALIGEDRRLLGEDWWPFGIARTATRSIPSCAIISSRVCRSGG